METNQTHFSLRRSIQGTSTKAKDKPSYLLSRGGLGAVTMATPSNKRKSGYFTSSHCRLEGRVSIYEPRHDKTRSRTVIENQRCALNNAICQNQDTTVSKKCSPQRPAMIRNSERQSGTKHKETATSSTSVVSPRSILKKNPSFSYRLPITVDDSVASGTKPGSSKNNGSPYRLASSAMPSVPKRVGSLKDTGMEHSISQSSQNKNFRYRLAPSSMPSVPKRVSFLTEADMEDSGSQSETSCSSLMMDHSDSSNVEYCKVLKEEVIYSCDFVSRPSRRQ